MTDLKDKWVRVMADYCSEGLWASNGAAVGDESLPVSKPLKVRLRAWQAQYDTELITEPAFSDEGRAIAQAIKAELPRWTIVYFDNDKAEKSRPGDSRAVYEYIIG